MPKTERSGVAEFSGRETHDDIIKETESGRGFEPSLNKPSGNKPSGNKLSENESADDAADDDDFDDDDFDFDDDEDEDEEDWDDPDYDFEDHDCIDIDYDQEGMIFHYEEAAGRGPGQGQTLGQALGQARAPRDQGARDYVEQYEKGTLNRDLAEVMKASYQSVTKPPPRRARRTEYLESETVDSGKPRAAERTGLLRNLKASMEKLNGMAQARQIEDYLRLRRITPTQGARELGLSRGHVLNQLRLLTLPPAVQDHIAEGRLTAGHGKILAGMRDPEAAARLIIRRSLSVRAAETLARRLRYVLPNGMLTKETAIPYTQVAEQIMEDALGLKVSYKDRAGRGRISVDYSSPQQAQMIVEKLASTFYGAGVVT